MLYTERIPPLKKACCCLDLRICCMIIGIIQFPITLLFAMAQIYWLYAIIEYQRISFFSVQSLDVVINLIDMFINLALLVATVFFIAGAAKRNIVHIAVYVRATAYVIVLDFLLAIISWSYFRDQAICYFIFVLWFCYVWIHAHSLHQQWLKEPQIRNLSTVLGRFKQGDIEELDQCVVSNE